MDLQRILITGGAGFVGSNLAVRFRQALPQAQVVALDNLTRRGSELNLPRLRDCGVEFVKGDVRRGDEILGLDECDVIIDCAAEPSVHAGLDGDAHPLIETNFNGTFHGLEAARRWGAAFLFLSTSRVYPMANLNGCPFIEDETRFRWPDVVGSHGGISGRGVTESFSTQGPRSLYGATKLASELLVEEYAFNFGVPAIINRCGILAGPWQMGKVDQGVVSLWVAAHHFRRRLSYLGFGGQGKQVRDMLHIDDLFDLLLRQVAKRSEWSGEAYNVGGGLERSASLMELTTLCEQTTGRRIEIESVAETSKVDLRIYVTDAGRVQRAFAWRPTHSVDDIVRDIHQWLLETSDVLEPVLG